MEYVKAGATHEVILQFDDGAWAIIQDAYAASPSNITCEFEQRGDRENTVQFELSQTAPEILITIQTEGWKIGVWRGDIRVVRGNHIYYFPGKKEYITFELVYGITEPTDFVEG